MGPVNPPRKKTFTGCWTCRSRRVKCDEQTPFCQRCRAFGVTCEGYGVRLTWVSAGGADDQPHPDSEEDAHSGQAPRPRRSMRTFGDSQTWPSPGWSTSEVDAMLERIDDCPSASSRTEHGIFSVFPAQAMPSSPPVRVTLGSATQDGLNPGSGPARTAAEPPFSSAQPHASLSFDHAAIDTPPASEASCPSQDARTIPVIPNPAPLTDGQESTLGGSIAAEPTEPVTLEGHRNSSRAVDAVVYQRHQPKQQQPLRHLDLLRMPASQKRLIHHWVTFTSAKLVLVDEPHNPCRTMMLPMALKGLQSDLDESTADIAIFHAICACAAYNLFELGGRRSEADRALAWKHDEQAIHHLRYNLAQADQHRNQSFAMAIMACITIEAISGNTGRWRTHLNGGLAYLAKLRERAVDTDMSSAFQVHLVSMAILCGYQVPDDLKSFLRGPEQPGLSFPYYGASPTFLDNLDRINTIAASSTATDEVELDAFEIQLYLNFPTGSLPGSLGGQPQVHAAVMHHMAQAFYYACVVHYQRSVRRTALEEVQTLVEKGVAQLEAIETVSQGSAGSVMMWAPLVLAAESNSARLQQRVRSWFRSKRDLGFRNLIVLEDMVRELWNKRAYGDTETSWQDLIAETDFDVFRL